MTDFAKQSDVDALLKEAKLIAIDISLTEAQIQTKLNELMRRKHDHLYPAKKLYPSRKLYPS